MEVAANIIGTTPFNAPLIGLGSVDSTNNYAADLLPNMVEIGRLAGDLNAFQADFAGVRLLQSVEAA